MYTGALPARLGRLEVLLPNSGHIVRCGAKW